MLWGGGRGGVEYSAAAAVWRRLDRSYNIAWLEMYIVVVVPRLYVSAGSFSLRPGRVDAAANSIV